MKTTKRRRSAEARERVELPELLAAILAQRGADVTRRGNVVVEATLPGPLAKDLGTERVRFVASPAGRAARGAETDAALTERILLIGRSMGSVTRVVARLPQAKPSTSAKPGTSAKPTGAGKRKGDLGDVAPIHLWVRLHWRIRYGSDDLPEELLAQTLPIGTTGGARAPRDAVLREPTADEAGTLAAPDPERLTRAWHRALRQLELRIRTRLRPHEDRVRRELHREMRTLSVHFRSLIAEERAGRRRRAEDGEAGRMLQLKEDWERKLAAAVRQRAFDTEARLVAASLIYLLPPP